MINLTGKVAFITGGSSGIGAACVKLFREAGAEVIFTYHGSEEKAEEIKEKYGAAAIYKLDVADESMVYSVVESVAVKFGKIDIAVNNAGIYEEGTLEDSDLAKWNKTIITNLNGTFLVTRSVARYMKRENYGRIINISSTSAQVGESNHSSYAASKGGINSMTKSLASELGPFGITVNAVAPGWVKTPMTEKVFDDKEYLENEIRSIPVRKIATPEDIAGPVLFLASDFANYINGEILNVNGGLVLYG